MECDPRGTWSGTKERASFKEPLEDASDVDCLCPWYDMGRVSACIFPFIRHHHHHHHDPVEELAFAPCGPGF